MRVRGGGEPPKPASSRDNDSLQHSLNTQCSGSPLYISQQDQENYLEWMCLYIKSQIITIINSTDFQLILMTIKRDVGDRNHSRISYSALDKCDRALQADLKSWGPIVRSHILRCYPISNLIRKYSESFKHNV